MNVDGQRKSNTWLSGTQGYSPWSQNSESVPKLLEKRPGFAQSGTRYRECHSSTTAIVKDPLSSSSQHHTARAYTGSQGTGKASKRREICGEDQLRTQRRFTIFRLFTPTHFW